jgi:predicted MPP superfamily phosphohydrolase
MKGLFCSEVRYRRNASLHILKAIDEVGDGIPSAVHERLAGMSRERKLSGEIDIIGGHFALGEIDGDLNGGVLFDERREIGEGLAAFGKLKAPLGVWSVLGNHDWWYDGPAVESGLVITGVQVMENSRARIPREDGAFWIGGLADYESRRAQPSYTNTLAGVPDNEPIIVLSHWPDPFAAAPAKVALTLAGHSHCGQVNLPLVGRLVHVSPGAERWPCGLYEDRGGWLYVSGGVGTSILPVRFNQPPEIAVLTLRGF